MSKAKLSLTSIFLLAGITVTFPSDDENFTFIGNWLVAEQYRHKGIGSKLWNTVMEYLENTNHKKDMAITVYFGNQIIPFYVERGFKLVSKNEISIYRGFFLLFFAIIKLIAHI